MNRTLLLILCDFLLLTLLALTRWETAEPERPAESNAPQSDHADSAVTATDDIVELMKLSFEDQRAEQMQMEERLATELEARAAELAERERALRELEAARNTLQSERAVLATDLEQTRQQATAAASEAAASKERLAQLQRDLEARERLAADQAKQLEKLESAQAQAQQQIQNLNVAVKVAEQEKVLLRETADTFRAQAETERQERIKIQETTTQLAEGVGALAEKSALITQEMRDNRPINANILFSDFLVNRVPATFNAARINVFGNELTRNAQARTLLVSDGAKTYAIMHIEDTPLNFAEPPSQWARIGVSLVKDGVNAPAARLDFLASDPRVVVLPLDESQVAALKVKVYRTTTDPFRFAEAVLIGNGGEGYGEVPFKLEANRPGYVRMDNRLIRRLAGDYTPRRGDLALSKTGELLGVMVTSDLCVMIDSFLPAASIRTGDTRQQNIEALLNTLLERVAKIRD